MGGASQTQAQAPGAAPRGSDKYQNLQSYLNVGGGDFGNQFAGKVLGESAEAGKQIGEASNQFKGQVDQSKVSANPDLVNRAIANPTDFVKDQSNVDAFAKQRDAQYKGPSSISETPDLYNRAYGATQKAVSSARAAQTEPGRFTLLDTYFGKPQYSQGQKSLDNLLLSGDQNAEQGIRQAKENALAQQSSLGQKSNELSNYAAQARGATESARNAARGAVGLGDNGQLTDTSPSKSLYKDIENRVSGINAGNAGKYSSDLSSLKIGQISKAEANRLGISDLIGKEYYNLDPSSYLRKGEEATIPKAASKEEQAKLAALSKLSGVENTLLPDAGTAGTYDPNSAYSFDEEKYNKDIRDKNSDLNNYLKKDSGFEPSRSMNYYDLQKLLSQYEADNQYYNNPALYQPSINRVKSAMKPYEDYAAKAKGKKLTVKGE